MTTQNTPNSSEQYETIKLGIDAHAKWYYVSRQVDGATPQPVQKMTFEELLLLLLGNCFRARRTGNGQNGDGRRGVRGSDRPLSALRWSSWSGGLPFSES